MYRWIVDRWIISPINLYDNMDQVINVRINQPLFCVLFSHESIVDINVTLKVKAVLMFLLWIASIAVQPEINKRKTTVAILQNTARIFFFCTNCQSMKGNREYNLKC